jgi:hypothetical protein
VLLICFVLYYLSLRSEFRDFCYDFRMKTMFGSSLPPVICRRAHVSFTLVVFVWYSGVIHILCCVFVLFFFSSCVPMLPVSLYCPFLIASSVFSNVYSKQKIFN